MERPANSARHVAAEYYVEHPLQRRNMLRRYCIARLAPLALWHGGTSADLRHSDKGLVALDSWLELWCARRMPSRCRKDVVASVARMSLRCCKDVVEVLQGRG